MNRCRTVLALLVLIIPNFCVAQADTEAAVREQYRLDERINAIRRQQERAVDVRRPAAPAAEVARITKGDLSKNWVVFHSGANNQWVTGEILEDRKIKLGDQDRKGVEFYSDSPFDAVPNIIGLNGNPLEILGSVLASPLLFAGPEWSPHTMPYSPPPAPSSTSQSDRTLPVVFTALEGVTP